MAALSNLTDFEPFLTVSTLTPLVGINASKLIVEYDDGYSTSIVLHNLAQLWRDGGDTELPAAIASVLKKTKDEVEQELRGMLEGGGVS